MPVHLQCSSLGVEWIRSYGSPVFRGLWCHEKMSAYRPLSGTDSWAHKWGWKTKERVLKVEWHAETVCVCVVRYIMDNAGENWICFHKEVEIVEQVEDWCCMCLLWVIYVCTVSIYTQHAPWWGLVWPLNVCLHANANRGCDFEGHMLYMDFRGLLACKCDVCKYKI